MPSIDNDKSILVRRALQSDAAAIWKFMSQPQHLRNHFLEENTTFESFYKVLPINEWSSTFVAEIDGVAVGVAEVRPHFGLRRGHAANIWASVHDDYAGRGVGPAVMKAAIRAAEAEGIERLESFVCADNAAALKMDLRLGFQIESRHPRFARWRNEYIDAVMVSRFTPRLA